MKQLSAFLTIFAALLAAACSGPTEPEDSLVLKIDSFQPDSANYGYEVTVSGRFFLRDSIFGLKVGDYPVKLTSITNYSLKFLTPIIPRGEYELQVK
ncbi:MAG: IPT/TIG domain-containing protein, partial [Candidatus Kapaibacterium sp.]